MLSLRLVRAAPETRARSERTCMTPGTFPWVAEAACRAGRRGCKERGLGGRGRAGEAGRVSPLRARVPRAILGASQGAQVVKRGPASAGDVRDAGLIPGSGRPPGGGNGNPRWYSCLGNPMDRGAWWAAVHGSQRARHDWATEHACVNIRSLNIPKHTQTHRHTDTQTHRHTHTHTHPGRWMWCWWCWPLSNSTQSKWLAPSLCPQRQIPILLSH